MAKVIDITGKKYGRLTVLALDGRIGPRAAWLVRCDCGTEKRIAACGMKNGTTVSCGCYGKENSSAVNKTHGESQKTPEYAAWRTLITKSKVSGVGLIDRWNIYSNFISDVGRRPTPKHHMSTDPDGKPFSLENCRWKLRSRRPKRERTRWLPPEVRLFRDSRPNEVTGCIEWTKHLDESGYGVIGYGSRCKRTHRVSWEFCNGPIPSGLCVLHRCDNPKCLNVSHLFLGTKADNNADKLAKGRQSKGSKHGFAKLTEEDVSEIRRRHANGEKQKDLAEEYGVSGCAIWQVVSRKYWRHVS